MVAVADRGRRSATPAAKDDIAKLHREFLLRAAAVGQRDEAVSWIWRKGFKARCRAT